MTANQITAPLYITGLLVFSLLQAQEAMAYCQDLKTDQATLATAKKKLASANKTQTATKKAYDKAKTAVDNATAAQTADTAAEAITNAAAQAAVQAAKSVDEALASATQQNTAAQAAKTRDDAALAANTVIVNKYQNLVHGPDQTAVNTFYNDINNYSTVCVAKTVNPPSYCYKPLSDLEDQLAAARSKITADTSSLAQASNQQTGLQTGATASDNAAALTAQNLKTATDAAAPLDAKEKPALAAENKAQKAVAIDNQKTAVANRNFTAAQSKMSDAGIAASLAQTAFTEDQQKVTSDQQDCKTTGHIAIIKKH